MHECIVQRSNLCQLSIKVYSKYVHSKVREKEPLVPGGISCRECHLMVPACHHYNGTGNGLPLSLTSFYFFCSCSRSKTETSTYSLP